MSNLGNLYYDVLLKDKTDEEYEKIKKKLLNMRIQLEASVGFKADEEAISRVFDRIVKNRSIKIPVEIDTSGVERMMETVSKEGVSTSGLRAMRGWSSIIRAQAFEESQKALARQRNALAKLREAHLDASKAADRHNSSSKKLNSTIGSSSKLAGELKNQLANIYSVYAIERFVRGLIEIGGQFEQQKIAIGAILQDSAKAEVIFGKIKSLAVVSPFQFMDLAGYTKQLTAFSIPYEELYDTTKRLADISAGLGVDMGRIILAYGQVRSAAFLRGQEVRQFTEAGIPLVQALADKYSLLENRIVSAGEVFDKISRREVSFDMVKDVLWGMTDEGGQFYNMQEKLADSLYGKWSNLKDQWDVMMSDIAEDTNGTLKSGIEGITKLMESWKSIISILTSVSVAYGTYKAVVMIAGTANAFHTVKVLGFKDAIDYSTLSLTGNTAALKANEIAGYKQLSLLGKLRTSLSSLGKAGWIGILLSGLAAIGTYIYTAYRNSTKLKRELESIASKGSISAQNEIDGYTILVEKLRNAVKGSQEYNSIIDKIQSRYGSYLGNIKAEADAYEYLHGKITDVTEALRAKATEDAREQGVSKITEKYTEEKTDVYKDIISSLQKEFGISKEFASQLAAVIQSDITNGLGDALAGSYNKALEYIKSKAKELGKELGNPISERRVWKTGKYGNETSTGGATNTIDYFNSFLVLVAKEKNELSYLDNTLKAVMGTTTAYGIKIEELEKAYDKERESIKDTSKQKELYLQLLEAKKKVYEDFGQEKEVRQIESEISAVSKAKEEWVGLAEEYANAVTEINSKKIKAVSLLPQEDERENIVKYLKRIAEEYERIKKDIEDLNNVPFPARGESWQESIGRANFKKKQYDNFINSLGIDLNNFMKGTSDKKDPVADMWKKRIELVDKAIQSYNKWKEVEGKDASESRVKESDTYRQLASSGIDVDFQNPQKTYEYIKSKLGNTENQKELSLSIGVKIDNYELEKAKEDAQKAVDDIKKYIEEKSKQWDLYKQLFEITGDKRESMLVAFQGDNGFESYIEELKGKMKSLIGDSSDETLNMVLGFDEQKIKDTFGKTAEEILKIQEELKQKMDEERITSLIDEAKVIQKFATTAQKIKALNAQYLEKTGGIVGEKGTIELPENATEGQTAYFKEYKEELSKITDESVKLLPLWQKLFGDTTQMGYRGLVKLVDEAKKFAGTAVKKENPVTKKTEYVLTYKDNGVDENVTLSLETYLKLLEQIQKEQDNTKSQNPFKAITDGFKNLKEAENEGDKESALKSIGVGANEAAQMITEVADAWSNMLSDLGNEDLADTIGLVGELTGELGKLAEGLTSGNPIQMASSVLTFIPNIISSIARFHDKKLDKAIQKSALEVKKLQNAYTNMQSVIEHQLGSVMQSQAKEMMDNLKKQRDEVESQRRAEEDKKKSDSSKIEDYKQQLHELDEQIKYLYEDLANEQYGIDLKSWSDQISDAIVTAFQNGEDAAQAFDDTVADIMRSVVKNMISLQYIQPAMEKLRKYLFGDSGIFTLNSENSTDLSRNEAIGLGKELENMKKTISQSKYVWDYINGALKGIGVDLEENKDKNSSLIKGVQSITEDQADILASYVNSIRYDTSTMREAIEKLGLEILPQYNIVAEAQLKQLNIISKNTTQNVMFVEEIRDMLMSVVYSTNTGRGIKVV